jgi:DNA-binding GntR family transcriptional regulator
MSIGLRTAGEQAYDELRRQIVTGELAPGAPLPLEQVASELGVSTTPVRAALSRLQTEGLAVHYRHRGAIVAPLDLDDLEVIQAVRDGIEGRAALLGAPRLADGDIAAMHDLLRQLDAVSPTSSDDYLRLNWQLHDICYAGAAHQKLLDLIHSYQRRAERYIRLVVQDDEGWSASLAQQTDFVAACEARNGKRAQRVIRDALEYTVTRLATRLTRDPD